MKRKHTVLTAIGAITALAVSMSAAHDQKPASGPPLAHGKTPAYYIADFELTDPEGIKPYRDQVDATFERYGGRYIVRAAHVDGLEGSPPNHRLIIIGFDSLELARAWYNSPEYARIRPFRQRSGHTNAYIVEGLPQ
jgi:uncharacterized protein (DUF1330 family)